MGWTRFLGLEQLLSPEQKKAEVIRLQGITEFTSGIERKLHKILGQWRVEHVSQFLVGHYTTDIYIPRYNLIIEAFGCYWHHCAKCGFSDAERWTYDARRLQQITEAGYKVAVIWEHDIRRDPEEALQSVFRAMTQQVT